MEQTVLYSWRWCGVGGKKRWSAERAGCPDPKHPVASLHEAKGAFGWASPRAGVPAEVTAKWAPGCSRRCGWRCRGGARGACRPTLSSFPAVRGPPTFEVAEEAGPSRVKYPDLQISPPAEDSDAPMGYQGQQTRGVIAPQVKPETGAGFEVKFPEVPFTLQLWSATFTWGFGLALGKFSGRKSSAMIWLLFFSWQALFNITLFVSLNHIIGSLQILYSGILCSSPWTWCMCNQDIFGWSLFTKFCWTTSYYYCSLLLSPSSFSYSYWR